MIRASKFFALDNRLYWRDRRVRILQEDARNVVRYAKRPYDVIISEPSNPWVARVGNLYTVEAYEAFRRALSPGGVMIQWAHVYEMSPEVRGIILRSFRAVFPAKRQRRSAEPTDRSSMTMPACSANCAGSTAPRAACGAARRGPLTWRIAEAAGSVPPSAPRKRFKW